MFWSPDGTKILYTASTSATMPKYITPALIGTDSTPENRNLQPGNMYVYDTKEDKNFLIATSATAPSEKIMWFPDSKHLIVVADKMIYIEEYDGQNKTTIYAGPFMDSYVFPWSTTDNLVMLTNLGNPDIAPNLYTVGLK
jgi:Tol biopolymer transport system component